MVQLSCGVFLGALVLLAKGDHTKMRLCIQYEMEDYNSSMIPLKKLSEVTRGACFVECLRHQQGSSPCRAFHFRQVQGICELLPHDVTCMAENMTPGTTYVHLSECDSVAPWRRINPDSGPLQWVADRDGALGFLGPFRRYRYVVRVLYKGMWLPGYATRTAKTARPDGGIITCRSNIQYINSSEPAPYRWVSFSVGDPVPDGAFVAGYWPNGTPLYIVYWVGVTYAGSFSGYYNAESLQIGPNNAFRPGSLRILVESEWIVGLYGDYVIQKKA